jgi:hypothetical protein
VGSWGPLLFPTPWKSAIDIAAASRFHEDMCPYTHDYVVGLAQRQLDEVDASRKRSATGGHPIDPSRP